MPVTRLKSRWTSGVLEFYDDSSGKNVFRLDALNLKAEVSSGATLSLLNTITDVGGRSMPGASLMAGASSGARTFFMSYTTSSNSDSVATGLTTVLAAIANLDSTPTIACDRVTAFVGVQSSSASATNPGAGSIFVRSWAPNSSVNAIPTVGSSFGKTVSLYVLGTT